MKIHVVLPNDIDDPAAPSGGNTYDRRVCHGLAAVGWQVQEHPVRGGWPDPTARESAALAEVLASLPDEAIVLVDGLVASGTPEMFFPHARRLNLVVLMHMPLGGAKEHDVLRNAAAVVTTSLWSRRRLLDLHDLPVDRVHVAPPGVDIAPPAVGSDAGNRLLCVAAVAPHKGHDLLMRSLAMTRDLAWSCACVGTLDRDRAFAERLRTQARQDGIADRVSFTGPRVGSRLEASYAEADLLVLASRGETFGMVVTEALAREIPVLATDAGGLPEALGHAPDGTLPGILVPPGDPVALARALRRWLRGAELRSQLRRSARERRTTLTGWAATTERIAAVLSRLSVHKYADRA